MFVRLRMKISAAAFPRFIRCEKKCVTPIQHFELRRVWDKPREQISTMAASSLPITGPYTPTALRHYIAFTVEFSWRTVEGPVSALQCVNRVRIVTLSARLHFFSCPFVATNACLRTTHSTKLEPLRLSIIITPSSWFSSLLLQRSRCC